MPHINPPDGVPGSRSALAFRPETAAPLPELAEALLRADDSLRRGERELIAGYASSLKDCLSCETSHSTFAAPQLEGGPELVSRVERDPGTAPIGDKLGVLLALAAKVQAGGRRVDSDVEIDDAVLMAAASCMLNRCVGGLATWAPTDPRADDETGGRLVSRGQLVAVAGPPGGS